MATKRMRLPNGFGQISKIKNKRLRKPYRAMVTVGKTQTGRPICKLLQPEAYFTTYNEAYEALLKYNRNPYDFSRKTTFKEVFDKWFEDYCKLRSDSAIRSVKVEVECCRDVWNMDLREIKAHHIKSCMDRTKSPKFKKGIRFIFQEVLSMGMEYGAVDTNVARDFSPKISQEGKKEVSDHTAFTSEELDYLWQNSEDPICRAILIQCYTGFRPDELCQLKKENINLEEWYIVGGNKTAAGKNRIVPVHEKIKGLVQEAFDNKTEYLLTTRFGSRLYYQNYYHFMKELFPNHKPHDPRKTFVTMAKRAGVNEFAIKRIVGHHIKDLTESVYTERDLEWLREEILKVV